MLSTLLLPSGLSPAPPFALGVYDSTWYPETPAGPGGPACPAGPRSPLLVWDYRGFGRSAPVTHPYTMADAAGLLAVTGWQSCRVAGVSFGGMVAQLKVADSRWDQRWLNAHPVDRVLAERLTAAGQDQQDPAAAAADAAQLQAREGHDVWDRLGAITCPALVGYGNYDGIARPATAKRSHRASAAPSCTATKAATGSCSKTRPPSRQSSHSSRHHRTDGQAPAWQRRTSRCARAMTRPASRRQRRQSAVHVGKLPAYWRGALLSGRSKIARLHAAP